MIELILIRFVFAIFLILAATYFRPFGLSLEWAVLIGVIGAVAIIIFESRLRQASLKRLIGAAFGSILGITGATLISTVLAKTNIESSSLHSFKVGLFLLMAYIGLVLGANKGDLLNFQRWGAFLAMSVSRGKPTKFWIPVSSSMGAFPIFAKLVLLTVF